MMGRQRGGQKQLFYSFNLNDHVPLDHLLRGIDQFLDLGGLRQHLARFYSHTGRPSIEIRLRDLPDEGALLSEHTDAEDRAQHS